MTAPRDTSIETLIGEIGGRLYRDAAASRPALFGARGLRRALLEKALEPYAKTVPIYWVQEEPANMGAWTFLRVRFGCDLFGRPFHLASRAASASPAAGSAKRHKQEQAEIIARAFGEK